MIEHVFDALDLVISAAALAGFLGFLIWYMRRQERHEDRTGRRGVHF